MTTTTTAAEPRIWLGCLHCYNSGRLVGRWFPASGGDEITLADVHAGTRIDYAREGCEELWCLDTDNIPVNREMSAAEAAQWGGVYDEVGETQWPAICAWVRIGSYIARGHSDLPVVSDFEEAYCGEWESFTVYADELIEDLGLLDQVPDELRGYFDTRAYARDLAMDYHVEPTGHGGVYVFRAL